MFRGLVRSSGGARAKVLLTLLIVIAGVVFTAVAFAGDEVTGDGDIVVANAQTTVNLELLLQAQHARQQCASPSLARHSNMWRARCRLLTLLWLRRFRQAAARRLPTGRSSGRAPGRPMARTARRPRKPRRAGRRRRATIAQFRLRLRLRPAPTRTSSRTQSAIPASRMTSAGQTSRARTLRVAAPRSRTRPSRPPADESG